jgi:hypothetical protein
MSKRERHGSGVEMRERLSPLRVRVVHPERGELPEEVRQGFRLLARFIAQDLRQRKSLALELGKA